MLLPSTAHDFLATQRVGVLAVEMLDGSPHAATVHFAHQSAPLRFYYETYPEYRKAEPIQAKETVRASFVVGTAEAEMKTLQLDGIVQRVQPADQAAFDAIYFAKFPDKRAKADERPILFFTFEPTWWRFTDWQTPTGKLELASTDG